MARSRMPCHAVSFVLSFAVHTFGSQVILIRIGGRVVHPLGLSFHPKTILT